MKSKSHLTSLPTEIRRKIFRYLALSQLSEHSLKTGLLPRPLLCEGRGITVGNFKRDEIIPLLLICRTLHDDAATILYGENVFVFHISGLERDLNDRLYRCKGWERHQILGLDVFSERYWPLVRRLWVRVRELDT